MEFQDAFVRLQSDEKLAEKFVDDPAGVLEIMGVDTSELIIQPSIGHRHPVQALKEAGRLGPDAPLGITVCASVGVIVCASVGGEVDLPDWPLAARGDRRVASS